MAKTAKITEIWKSYSFESKFWTRWNIKIKLDDWTEGSIIKEKQDALNVGDEITYETTEDDYGVHIKQIQQKKWSWWSKTSDKVLLITKAMEYAIQLKIHDKIDSISDMFEKIYNLMNAKNGQ